LIKARTELLHCKIEVQRDYLRRIIGDNEDAAAEDDLKTFEDNLNEIEKLCDHSETLQGDGKMLHEQIELIKENEINNFHKLCDDHCNAFERRGEIYADFVDDSIKDDADYSFDNFKTELLKHLSQTVFVKEHRNRYQKEQWDRYWMSYYDPSLKRHDITLKEFAHKYAYMIENQIAGSFHYRTPKIDANYDDYEEKTLRPLNATIFYHFFRGSRLGKKFAQWMLSTIRFPNEKMRQAYMRFFN